MENVSGGLYPILQQAVLVKESALDEEQIVEKVVEIGCVIPESRINQVSSIYLSAIFFIK